MTRLVSLDFETTGTVPGWENEPWQLGCVEIVDGEPVAASRWETYFRIPADRPFSPRPTLPRVSRACRSSRTTRPRSGRFS